MTKFEVGDYLGRLLGDNDDADGYCGGYFGRDDYDLKRVLTVSDTEMLVVVVGSGGLRRVTVGPVWASPDFPSWEVALKYRLPRHLFDEHDQVRRLAPGECPKCGATGTDPCITGGYAPIGDLPGDPLLDGQNRPKTHRGRIPLPQPPPLLPAGFTPDPIPPRVRQRAMWQMEEVAYTMNEGTPGTWSHCHNARRHEPHRHTVGPFTGEQPIHNVLCKGTPGDPEGDAPLGRMVYDQ